MSGEVIDQAAIIEILSRFNGIINPDKKDFIKCKYCNYKGTFNQVADHLLEKHFTLTVLEYR